MTMKIRQTSALAKSMNLKFFLVAAILIIIAGTTQTAFTQVKLAYVDSQTILEKSADAQAAQKQLAALNKSWEEEIRAKEQELQSLQEELEAKQLMLSEAAIKEKQTEIQNKYLAYQQFQQEKWGPQGELQKRQAELMQPIIKKINETIREVGDAEGYDYIFDVASGSVVHVSTKQVDLTEKIITELGKTAQ